MSLFALHSNGTKDKRYFRKKQLLFLSWFSSKGEGSSKSFRFKLHNRRTKLANSVKPKVPFNRELDQSLQMVVMRGGLCGSRIRLRLILVKLATIPFYSYLSTRKLFSRWRNFSYFYTCIVSFQNWTFFGNLCRTI